jgi:hypothetical protein
MRLGHKALWLSGRYEGLLVITPTLGFGKRADRPKVARFLDRGQNPEMICP